MPRYHHRIITPREAQVLQLVSEGYTDGEIAALLVTSVHTIHRTVEHASAKLGARSRAQAVARAIRYGFVELEDDGKKRNIGCLSN